VIGGHPRASGEHA